MHDHRKTIRQTQQGPNRQDWLKTKSRREVTITSRRESGRTNILCHKFLARVIWRWSSIKSRDGQGPWASMSLSVGDPRQRCVQLSFTSAKVGLRLLHSRRDLHLVPRTCKIRKACAPQIRKTYVNSGECASCSIYICNSHYNVICGVTMSLD